jgi:phenylpropionate dioxygenase-like ring-hydroxylating dioxygenase large terminal subunit
MYFRDGWYMAGWSGDFAADKPAAMTLLDEPVVFYRQSSGKITAFEDRCCHRLAPLSLGRVEGDDLRCLYHGLKFAPDGVCNEMPGQAHIPKAMKVRSYPTLERYGAVWIWMGDIARADEKHLPNFVGPEDPAWHMAPGRMDYDCNYELIQDNLLDLSHVAWVHRNSFGGGNAGTNKAWMDAELRIERMPRGVRVQRWMRDSPAPPHRAEFAGQRNDVLTSFEYHAPGIFLLTSSNFPVGTALQTSTWLPTVEPIYSSFTAQAVTPFTQKSACYFFCFGPWARVPDGEAQKKKFLDLAMLAFGEDRVMLTAQQKIIDADPTRRMSLFDVDKAPALYRRVLQDLGHGGAKPQ